MVMVKLIAVASCAAGALLLSGCAQTTETTSDPAAAASVSAGSMAAVSQAEKQESVIVDVRTPQEYAGGHVQGAVNINVQAPDFLTRMEQYPKDEPVTVYCRSGNRSAAAAQMLKDAGFTNITDAGSVQQAADFLRLPLITP